MMVMSLKPEMSIIVPAFNEEKRLPTLLNALSGHISRDVVVVAVNGSEDMTAEIALSWGAKVIGKNVLKLGKGGCILNAAKACKGDFIVTIDSDFKQSWMLPHLPTIMTELNADLLVGKRDYFSNKPPLRRRIASRLFRWLVWLLFGRLSSDTQCGFKVMKRQVILELADDIRLRGFAWDVELLLRAKQKGYHIEEFPILESYSSDSKLNLLGDGFAMCKDLLKLWFIMHFQRDEK